MQTQQAAKARKTKSLRATNRNKNIRHYRPDVQLIRSTPPVNLNAFEAAIYTGLSERNFRKLATEGVFPRIRVGRRLLFRRAALDDALAQLESNQLTITRRETPAPRRAPEICGQLTTTKLK